MNILQSIFKHKFIIFITLYAVGLTGFGFYTYHSNQNYYNYAQTRMSYFENTIRNYGLDFKNDKGIYCVAENRCDWNAFNLLGAYAKNEAYVVPSVVNPWNHLQPDYSQMSSIAQYAPPPQDLYQQNWKPVMYGWIGGNKVQFDFEIVDDQISGKYFSTLKEKNYDISGRVNYQNDDRTGFAGSAMTFNELEGGRLTGRFEIGSEKPGSQCCGSNIPANIFRRKGDGSDGIVLKTLSGYYTGNDNVQYDVYLSTDQKEIDNWKSKPFSGKLLNNNANQSVFIQVGEQYYFTKNMSKFKNIPNGSNISFVAKTRKATQGDFYTDKNVRTNFVDGGYGASYNSNDLLFEIIDITYVESEIKTSQSVSSQI
jgi:hypothetical protein